MESKKIISDKSKAIVAKTNNKKTTGKALQMNENSAEATDLYEDKTANLNGEHSKKQGKDKAVVTPDETSIPVPAKS